MEKGGSGIQPLEGPDLRAKKWQIQKTAISQLLQTWKTARQRVNDPFLWGDEIECLLVTFDHDARAVRPASPPWQQLQDLQNEDREYEGSFQREFGSFMLETTPARPFGDQIQDLLSWEGNFIERRELVSKLLPEHSYLLTIPYFPRLGVGDNARLETATDGDSRDGVMKSAYLPDETITDKTRYRSIVKNILYGRGENVAINVPIFQDKYTPWPWQDATVEPAEQRKENHIYMDATAFGSTGCSLQVTMQALDIDEARRLHDQLIPLAPIMLALTAGSPIFRGFLADVDSRWLAFEQCVDDRSPEERARVDVGPNRSRASTSTTYISQDAELSKDYHLQDLEMDAKVKSTLMHEGMDSLLATHFAHLYSRDPLYASAHDLETTDASGTQFSDGLQSNIYQLVRFKPPSDDRTGWRVEFRPMEVQTTDFDNTAFAVFIILAAKTILVLKLNLYISLHHVGENMAKAWRVEAAISQRFWFRRNITGPFGEDTENTFALMTADEILNGDRDTDGHMALIPLIKKYMQENPAFTPDIRQRLERYLDFVGNRASGKVPTTARWMRDFVAAHPEYGFDSTVSEAIVYDMLQVIVQKSI